MRKNGKPVTDHQKFAENSFDHKNTSAAPAKNPRHVFMSKSSDRKSEAALFVLPFPYLTVPHKLDTATQPNQHNSGNTHADQIIVRNLILYLIMSGITGVLHDLQNLCVDIYSIKVTVGYNHTLESYLSIQFP